MKKLTTGSVLEIPLPQGLGYGYAMFFFMDEFFQDEEYIDDMIIIPYKFYSSERLEKWGLPLRGNELTAPLLTFRLRTKGENGWKIIGHKKPDFEVGYDFKKCIQYSPKYYGLENTLNWFLIEKFELNYNNVLDINKNNHLELHRITNQQSLGFRLLCELNKVYNLFEENRISIIAHEFKTEYSEFKHRPLYKDIPKEFWGRVIL